MQFYRKNLKKIAFLGLLTSLQLAASACIQLDPASSSQGDMIDPSEDYVPPSRDGIDFESDALDGLISGIESDDLMEDDPCQVCTEISTDAPGPVGPSPTEDAVGTTFHVATLECSITRAPTPKYNGQVGRAWRQMVELGKGFGTIALHWGTLGLKWAGTKLVDSFFTKFAGRKWTANLFKLNDKISKIARMKGWDAAKKIEKMFAVYTKYAKRTKATLKIGVVTMIAMALLGKGFTWLWDQVNPWGSGKKLEEAKKALNKRIDDLASELKPNNTHTEEEKVALVDELFQEIQKGLEDLKAMPTCTAEQKAAKTAAVNAFKKKYEKYLPFIKGLKDDLDNAEKVSKDTTEFMGELKNTLDAIAAADGDLDKYLTAALADISDEEADGLDDAALKKAVADAAADAGLTPEEIASLDK